MLHYSEVRGLRMAYREAGSGPPIVFLHGNPTSSFLWRNIIGPLAHHGRCLAPDLVGMGASDPLPDSGPDRYRFLDHREHLDALLTTIGADREVVVVGHDWGGVLGIDWARRHPDAVRGIAYMETLVAPVSWNSENAPDPDLFRPLRTDAGEQMVLHDNVFAERSCRGPVRPPTAAGKWPDSSPSRSVLNGGPGRDHRLAAPAVPTAHQRMTVPG